MSIYKHFQNRSTDFSQIVDVGSFYDLFTTASSGITVTPIKAIQHSTVFSCIRVLSETIGTLPVSVFQKNYKDGKLHRQKAIQHPLQRVLKKPNRYMTKFLFFFLVVAQMNLHGEFVAQVVKNKRGDILELIPLDKNFLTIYQSENGDIFYTYESSKHSKIFTLEKDEVLRVVGLTLDGITSVSPISYNKNSIGLSMALEEYGSNFFKNGANAGGAFKKDGVLDDVAFQRLKNDLAEKYQGLSNSGKPMLLEDGLDFIKFSIPNNDSQFLESRKFQKSEIAGIFRVPPHMIGDLEKATFSNIEQQSLDFANYSILHWVVRIEDALNDILLDNSDKFYIKFNMDVIKRADMKTRYEGYGKAIKDGWLSRNEVREKEDLNPAKGLDEYLYPLNMAKESDEDGKKEED